MAGRDHPSPVADASTPVDLGVRNEAASKPRTATADPSDPPTPSPTTELSAVAVPAPAQPTAAPPAQPNVFTLLSTSLFGAGGLDSGQPLDPTSPVAPNMFAAALWAAYRPIEELFNHPLAAPSAQATGLGLTTPTAAPISDDTAGATTPSATIPVDPYAEVLSPDGTRLYVLGDVANAVSVIDPNTTKVVGAPIPVGSDPTKMVINGAGTRLYVLDSAGNNVTVINTQTGKTVGAPIPIGDPGPSDSYGPNDMVISPNGNRLYVNTGAGNVRIINTQTAKPVGGPISVGGEGLLAISPDGGRLYEVTQGPGYDIAVHVLDTKTLKVTGAALPIHTGGEGIAISPDGTRLYESDANSVIHVIDTRTLKVIATSAPATTTGIGGRLTISPDGNYLYQTDGELNDVHVTDTRTLKTVGSPIHLDAEPTSLAISASGSTLYVSTRTNIAVFDSGRGNGVFTLIRTLASAFELGFTTYSTYSGLSDAEKLLATAAGRLNPVTTAILGGVAIGTGINEYGTGKPVDGTLDVLSGGADEVTAYSVATGNVPLAIGSTVVSFGAEGVKTLANTFRLH